MTLDNAQIKGIILASIFALIGVASIGSTAKSMKEKNITFSQAVRGIITNRYTKSMKRSISSPISWETNSDKASGSNKRRKSKRRK